MQKQAFTGLAMLSLFVILALAGLISPATLVLGPARLASPQAIVPSWSYTSSLKTGRYAHTATLLENGQVLVAGGFGFGECDIKDSAELYNPSAGEWSYTR